MTMKTSLRVFLCVLCAALILCMPFTLPSATMLDETMFQLLEEAGGEDEGLLRFLIPSASAEEETKKLPIDFSAGSVPDETAFTEDSYMDGTISVTMETREENGVVWRIAWVSIQDASQLRTATAGKLTSSKVARPSAMAADKNAVVAINGDYYSNDPQKTTYEYRQGQKIRSNTNKKKDMLIIDENGDFHTVFKCGTNEGKAALKEILDAHEIVNCFTFGPVLVQNGEHLTMDKNYGYNPNGREPRAAIGQMGPLSYVLVIAEGRNSESSGATHQELADFMYALGCNEAFNLDGGNSATLIFHNQFYMNRTANSERAQSDIIYFASARDAE